MDISMIWPIALVVLSNIFYHISTKSAPSDMSPFASLTVTYLIGAAASALLYFTMNRGGSLIEEYRHLNWASIVLGVAIVGLEVGTIYMYKAGWEISVGQIVQSAILAVALIAVGFFVYHEELSAEKLIGIAVCMLGLWLINR